MALGTLLEMTGLIDDDRPAPPSPQQIPGVNYNEIMAMVPGWLPGLTKDLRRLGQQTVAV